MKRCPQCNRTYTDDALSFCLDDGSPLAAAPDPSATVQYPQPRDTTPQPTIAYNPNQPPPPSPPPACRLCRPCNLRSEASGPGYSALARCCFSWSSVFSF